MDNLYVNKKLLPVLIIIIVASYLLFITFDQVVSENFDFTKQELQLIKDAEDETIEVGLSEHFLWTTDNLQTLELQIKQDLSLNVRFKLISDGHTPLVDYPSGLYQSVTSQRPITRIGYVSNLYNTVIYDDKEVIAYKDFQTLSAALAGGEVDTLLLPYQGDYIFESNLKLIALSYENSLPITMASSHSDLNGIFIKAFNKYLDDGTMEQLQSTVNEDMLSKNSSLFFNLHELDLLKTKKTLNVGIENLPPIAYIKNKSIYGLAIALMNSFTSNHHLELDYTIGEYEKLTSMLDEDSLDLLFTTHAKDQNSSLIYTEPLVIISQHDVKYHTLMDNLLEETFIFYHENTSPYPGEVIMDFDTLIKDINDSKTDYYMLPKSMYELISEKIDTPPLYLNHITSETISYYFVGNPEIIQLFSKYSMLLNSDRLLDLTLTFIDDEKEAKTMWLITFWIVAILGISFIIFVIIRIILNINEKQRLNYLFKHDQLTYLPNNYGLKKIFDNINRKSGVLMLVDLRRFKLINDTYGNDIDDQILISLANQFNAIDEELVVARTSGDQFTFLLNTDQYDTYLKEILSVFEQFKTKESQAKKLNLSACYVEFPQYGDNYETLIQYLESAMYQTKSLSVVNRWVAFDDSIYQSYLKEQEMAIEIQSAIDHEDFLLFYQPQTELHTEKTIGAEVLVRWVHKEMGNIYPDQFLGVAERNGLMRKLDMYMIRKACEQLKVWQSLDYEQMKISVNMSTYTFESKNMSSELLEIIKNANIDTSWFAIEITEESGFSNLKYAKQVMDDIKTFGIRFALDDFGKGYSSLSYLEQLPFDFLKIDKAFVDHIHTNEKSRVLYYLITDLAKLYNMHIIAEGVEYLDQINIIKKDIETIIQGYYYSKPLPLDQFEDRLKKQ